MKTIRLVAWLVILSATCAFAQFSSNTARRIISGTAAPPGTCNAGPVDVYVRTGATSPGLYLCLTQNTWTGPLTVGGGGTPGGANTQIQYNNAGTFGGDSAFTTDGAGTLTDAQGPITTSKPAFANTVTWNAGGVAFSQWLQNITCTAAATASIAAGFGTAGTQWQFKYGAATCGAPQLLSPAGSKTNPSYSFSAATSDGIFDLGAGSLVFSSNNTASAMIQAVQFRIPQGSFFGWSNTAGDATTALDTGMTRPSAGVISTDSSTSGNGLGALTNCRTTVNVTPVTVNANVTTDQNLMAFTLPANCANTVGRTLRIFVAGVYSTAAASTAQMTLKVKICSVSGCGSGNVASVINIQSAALGTLTITNNAWNGTFLVSTQTGGAAGAWEAHGAFGIDEGALATAADSFFNDSNTTTVVGSPSNIDTTAQNFLQITFAFSAASASNSATQRQLVIDSVN